MTTRKRTVLIVDDESAQRAWMRGILRRQGYAVLDAADYTDALAVRARHDQNIDLFLIDLRLPGGSGYDLSQELLSKHPGSRILFVSGTAGAEICKYFANPLPDVQFLRKPFEAAQLSGRVREIFQVPAESLAANACANMSGHEGAPVVQAVASGSKRQRKC